MNFGYEAKRVFHNKTGLGNYSRDLVRILSNYFPDNNYFRLCDCDGYKAIQNNFAEMDVCWYDQKEVSVYPNTFFII